ncbi:MAG: DNA translocase FtsK 4TM domain-containing protein, partial [Coriobacteriales bacterium]|nr:DNA translocase FtsK 4TM domain-containing protein [Coriobacteriales bacterium]
MSAKKSGQSGNSKSNTNRRSSKSTASKSAASKKTGTAAKNNKAGKAARQPILESAIRLEVVGIILVVLAIALFIAVVAPGDALVTVAVSSALHMLFGVGALALPFLLAAWAASFFVRQPPSASRLRLSLGLLTIFLAALTLISLNTANATADPMRVFESSNLLSHGGYLGAALAWMLLSLVGYAIAMVIGIGAVIIGAVLTGFSLVSLAERLNSLFKAKSSEAPTSAGPYDLGEELDQPQTKRWQRGPGQAAQDPYDDGLLTPTARLAAESQSMSAANTWAGFAEDAYDDELDNLQDDPELGVTRRLVGREKRRDKTDDQALAESADSSSSLEPTLHPVDKQPEYQLPSFDLLKISRSRATSRAVDAELKAVAAELQETLQQFQVDAQVVGWTAGPTVTLYKLALGEGVRVARITSLSDDIALALAASSVRIFSPIPGTSLVGVEVPNAERSLVLLGDVLPQAPSGALQLAIGKDVEGASIVANLAGMPHLLIGGTTGSGKSVAINSMIMSMLMRTTPAEVR